MSAAWTVTLAISTAIGALLGSLIFKVFAHLVSEEVESRLDQLGYAVLRLACRRLPPTLRKDYYEEWAAELDAHFLGSADRPLTRLYWSLRFPGPLLFTARRVARIADPEVFADRRRAARLNQPSRFTRVVSEALLLMIIGGAMGAMWLRGWNLDSPIVLLVMVVAASAATATTLFLETTPKGQRFAGAVLRRLAKLGIRSRRQRKPERS